MTGTLKFLLWLALFFAAAQGVILNADDFQTCIDLCGSCEGTASFENGICKCSIREDDPKSLECTMRLKRAVTEDLDVESALNDAENVERSARCSLLGSRRRFASGDADRVASYFMNGGPITGMPLVGSPKPDCAKSSGDAVTGAINPSNAKPRPAEPQEKKSDPPTPNSPVIAAPHDVCSSPQHQPIVSSSWTPNYDAAYAPIIGAPQPYQTSLYPHMLGAIPHMVMAIPHAVMRAASHIPSHNVRMLGASHHSPLLASLASGTHGVLQRLDKMVSPYGSSDQNKIVGAPQHRISDCQHSSPSSYPNPIMVGAPAAQAPDSSQVNNAMLQQVLASQNSLLEALSQQLETLSPQVGAPAMQYTPVGSPHYMLGAPQPISQYTLQPMGQYVQPLPIGYYCPDGSSMVSKLGAAESSGKSAEASAKETEKVPDPNDADHTAEDTTGKKTPQEDAEAETEETKKSEEDESQKTKRENRSLSTNRKKRGDVKYVEKSETRGFSD